MSHTIYKAFRYRIEPNEEQKTKIHKICGCSRFVYNHFLDEWDRQYKNTGNGLSYTKCSALLTELKKSLDWLNEADSTALQSSLRDLSDAFSRFFRKQNDYPVFHRKNRGMSYTSKNNSHSIRILDDRHIKVPKLGSVRYRNSRDIEGEIMAVTISRKKSGKYYISVLCRTEVTELNKTGKSAGIDMGISDFATLSNGECVPNPRFNSKLREKLTKEQKKLSRMERANIDHYDTVIVNGKMYRKPIYKKPLSECRNYQKQRVKVARIHEKIVYQRKDFEHKLSTELVRSYDVICLEDLDVKGMEQDRKLAYAVNEVSWSEFTAMLEYKAAWYGKKVMYIDRFFPSSQTCSVCGNINSEVKDIAVREWTCPHCGVHHNRDINAAINIRNEGLRFLTP